MMKHVLEISFIKKRINILFYFFLCKQPGCLGQRLRLHQQLSNSLPTTQVGNLLGN